MGYVPSAEEKTVSEDVHLVYVDITWKELEPKRATITGKQLKRK